MSGPTARRAARRRSAFTLLEVTLAVSLSAVLILALYFAMSMQTDHARDARGITDENAVVRSILTRINSDVAAVQGPFNPYLNASNAYNQNASVAVNTSASTNSSSGGSGSSGSGSGGSGGSGTGSSSSSSSSSNSSTTTSDMVNVTLTNLGVSGQQDSVTFTVTRFTKEMSDAIASGQPTATPQCDIRRITYMVTENGLVRNEDTNLFDSSFSINGDNAVPATDDTKNSVIAPQVTKMQIRYYGPGGPASTWNSVNAGPEVTSYANAASSVQYYTQQGPPTAIEFTFTIKIPASMRGGQAREVQVRQVVAVATANRSSTLPSTR